MFSVSGNNGGEPYDGICSSCSSSYDEAAAIMAACGIFARIASLRAQGSFVS